jgi:hypothetical protein
MASSTRSASRRLERLEAYHEGEREDLVICQVLIPPGPAGYLSSGARPEAWLAFEEEHGAEAAEAARAYAEAEDPLLCPRILIRPGREDLYLEPGEPEP